MVAEPNIGLLADTVSKPIVTDRLLTLHCRRSRQRREGLQRVTSAGRARDLTAGKLTPTLGARIADVPGRQDPTQS